MKYIHGNIMKMNLHLFIVLLFTFFNETTLAFDDLQTEERHMKNVTHLERHILAGIVRN